MRHPYFNLLGISWRYATKQKGQFLFVYGMYIFINIAVAIHPLIYGWFVDALQREGTQVIRHTWVYVAAFLGLRLLEWSIQGPARVMERHLAFKISRNFMEDIYHKVLHLPVKWHQDNHTGSTINKVRSGYESLKDFYQNGFLYLQSFSKFFFSLAAMIYFSPLFGLIAILMGFFTIWVIFKFDKPFVKSLKEVNEQEHKVSSILFDSLSNIMTVITLRLEKRMIFSIIGKVKRVFVPFRKNVKINEWKWFTSQMLISLIFAVTVLGYAYQNWEPGTVFYMGGLVTLLIYVNQFTSVFNDVAHQYTRVVEYHTHIQMTEDIVQAYEETHIPESKCALPHNWRTLKIKNLNYKHSQAEDDREAGVLKDLNIQLTKGQKIALIGESGGGKSTLLGLLRGLHTPLTGVELMVDGKSNREFSCIANHVTLFPQDPEIFENTILYNITLGLPFSNEEVMDACEVAQFADVARALPNGIETNIQEKGVNLSGGQKQRLALARGILSALNSDIVLLDEPTSSVDPRTEAQIYNHIFRVFEDKVIVSSIHRLHLLTHFDYIYILDKGQIVEEGTFNELLANSNLFHQLWKHQDYQTHNGLLDNKSIN